MLRVSEKSFLWKTEFDEWRLYVLRSCWLLPLFTFFSTSLNINIQPTTLNDLTHLDERKLHHRIAFFPLCASSSTKRWEKITTTSEECSSRVKNDLLPIYRIYFLRNVTFQVFKSIRTELEEKNPFPLRKNLQFFTSHTSHKVTSTFNNISLQIKFFLV